MMVHRDQEVLRGQQDPKVRLVTWVCQANKVHQANRESKEILAMDSRMECNETLVHEVLFSKLLEHLDCPVPQVHLDPQV